MDQGLHNCLCRTSAKYTAAERVDAADGVMDGKYLSDRYYGSKIIESRQSTGSRSAADRVDAADGVMDGK